MKLEASAIVAAHTRLRGQLVDTPIIAGILLPDSVVSAELRVKVECIQQGGSIYFRGAQHWLGRHYGSLNGIVVHGGYRVVFASAHAARLQRTRCHVVLAEPVGDDLMALLEDTGAEVETVPGLSSAAERAMTFAAETGHRIVPSVEDEDFALGIATLGLELAEQLGSGVDMIYVAPSDLAPAIAQGLEAAGRSIPVEGVEPSLPGLVEGGADASESESLWGQLLSGMRIEVGPAGRAAFAAAVLAEVPVCAVLSD